VVSARGPRADRPKRRTFTLAYKLAIVEEYDVSSQDVLQLSCKVLLLVGTQRSAYLASTKLSH
jgi:hypothetical protein